MGRTTTRRAALLGVTAAVVLGACSGPDDDVPAFATVTVAQSLGEFEQDVATDVLTEAYPDATQGALATALVIAHSVCTIDGYEETAEGTSAVFAVRQAENGLDIMTKALEAGCDRSDRGAKFLEAVQRTPPE
jgi:hypothetical protein